MESKKGRKKRLQKYNHKLQIPSNKNFVYLYYQYWKVKKLLLKFPFWSIFPFDTPHPPPETPENHCPEWVNQLVYSISTALWIRLINALIIDYDCALIDYNTMHWLELWLLTFCTFLVCLNINKQMWIYFGLFHSVICHF